jgi:hypothetical protein
VRDAGGRLVRGDRGRCRKNDDGQGYGDRNEAVN